MTQHKVLGLVSGGKDSCFNLLHCVANGHEVIALATLTPDIGTDELDSHIYQSVGTTVPPLIAESMGIPHYSRIIRGRAVEQGPEYGDRLQGGQGSGVEGDETEDLHNLLQDVMIDHPDLTAVSTGAILSTYQRLRIEHVCSRLGLVSLAYLWQAEQLPLLEQMKACGMDVVLVKVAGVGLGREMVGSRLWDQMPNLRKLERIYGSHPAGEGGEYETLTLDSPLFAQKVKLVDTEVIITDPEPNVVAYLRIPRAELVPKQGWMKPSQADLRQMLGLDGRIGVESVLDERGMEVLERIGCVKRRRLSPTLDIEKSFDKLNTDPSEFDQSVNFVQRGRWFSASISISSTPDSNIGNEMRQAFTFIQDLLTKSSLSLPLHAAHITLLLPSMSLFPAANASYTKFFGTSPPSRATVAVPLPEGVGLRVEVVGYDSSDDQDNSSRYSSIQDEGSSGGLNSARRRQVGGRTSLHVQSLSYWAPANIGPYSQAITVNSRVQIAGQIPLIPSTLTIPSDPSDGSSPYPAQCALALQHVERVIGVLRSPMSTGGGWTGWIESVTVWWAAPPSTENGEEEGGEGEEVTRKAWNIWAEQNDCQLAPLLIVRAKELPRGALVEFQVNLHTGRRDDSEPTAGSTSLHEDDGDDDEDDEALQAIYDSSHSGSGIRWESCRTSGKQHRGSRGLIFLTNNQFDVKEQLTPAAKMIVDRAISMRVYHLSTMSETQVLKSVRHVTSSVDQDSIGVVLIPVFEIHNRNGAVASIALEVFGE